ncbi:MULTISPECIES: hypothetical protein [Alicyclobacillus]|uniref:Uncharacterized protein n=1 Tax=Alicyclobacillus acidoterrestris (strain ATCC 49025 / DSM 3922 / CIP 106132 / NCIMB 13137 / GD3B) TaxID=1356854 RepID=T0D7L3_ALIAG|nr:MULTISPECIES: hypothetical protein [Alicyclobacillus]EPZ47482.1 hypothetical protein N007_05980 [Alicyclobacillus acidoterrestris ATCC 49025]UNO48572.1 hypothetical protein K1I37_18210 [Alicyclobacillus acidoterrestris]
MRRKVANVANSRQKSLIYTCALIGLTVYGVPKLPKLAHGMAGTFTVVWLLFVALCVGANLYFLFGADKERKRLLEQQEVEVKSQGLRPEVRRLRG